MENRIFETFKTGGVQYIALIKGGSVQIVDEFGGNHGAYMAIESFKKYLKNVETETNLGKCKLTVWNLES